MISEIQQLLINTWSISPIAGINVEISIVILKNIDKLFIESDKKEWYSATKRFNETKLWYNFLKIVKPL